MRTTVVLMIVVLAAGCASAADTSSATSTAAASSAPAAGEARTGTLGGDPQLEGGCVWLETDDGTRVEVLWPEGYRASADPVELRDDSGAVVAGEGDRLLVRGTAASEQVSVCQVGELFRATAVEVPG